MTGSNSKISVEVDSCEESVEGADSELLVDEYSWRPSVEADSCEQEVEDDSCEQPAECTEVSWLGI